MTKPLSFDPVKLAADAGAERSSWHKLGDGPWFGTVVDTGGIEWEVEQLSTSWRATSSTAVAVTGKTLEQLLKKVLG